MKKVVSLLLLALISTSCSTIEDATSKWKTPDAPNAGLSEGEKSNYLNTEPTPSAAPEKGAKMEAKKKTEKKAKKKAKK